jgi:acyl-CoA synthetase (AMP-forming)/AMP-acid ligase II
MQHHHQLGRDHVLGIMSSNTIEYSTVAFGTLATGATVTTISPAYTATEVAYQLKDSGARYLMTQVELLPVALEAAKLASLPPLAVFTFGTQQVGSHTSLSTMLRHPQQARPVKLTPTEQKDRAAYLCYSSGTTGRSKGVEITHWNIVSNIQQCVEFEGHYEPGEVWIGVLPFYHIYGINICVHQAVLRNIPVVVMPKFDFGQLLKHIQNYRVSLAHLVPPIVLALAKHPIVDKFDLSSMHTIICGAAPLSNDTSIEVAQRLGVSIRQGYGMTELSPVAIWSPRDAPKHGSIGQLLPNQEAKIVDAQGNAVGPNKEGEVWIRGPNVMKGYLNNPQANADTIDQDGFLHTGDIGYMDNDGYFFIVDRIKELIKYKGFQVPPAELEAVLLTHPSIADAAVIPVMDNTQATELPKAFVVVKPNTQVTEQEIKQFVADRVAHYKQLRGGVEFIAEIPKSAAGKILRRILRDLEKTRAKL